VEAWKLAGAAPEKIMGDGAEWIYRNLAEQRFGMGSVGISNAPVHL